MPRWALRARLAGTARVHVCARRGRARQRVWARGSGRAPTWGTWGASSTEPSEDIGSEGLGDIAAAGTEPPRWLAPASGGATRSGGRPGGSSSPELAGGACRAPARPSSARPNRSSAGPPPPASASSLTPCIARSCGAGLRAPAAPRGAARDAAGEAVAAAAAGAGSEAARRSAFPSAARGAGRRAAVVAEWEEQHAGLQRWCAPQEWTVRMRESGRARRRANMPTSTSERHRAWLRGHERREGTRPAQRPPAGSPERARQRPRRRHRLLDPQRGRLEARGHVRAACHLCAVTNVMQCPMRRASRAAAEALAATSPGLMCSGRLASLHTAAAAAGQSQLHATC